MPVRLLTAYVEALPHVRAIAQMRMSESVAMGSGTLATADRTELAARLRRDVRRQVQRQAGTAGLVAVAGAGIGVRLVTPRGPADA